MNPRRLMVAALISVTLLGLTAAQTPRRRPPARSPATKPAPTPTPLAQPTPVTATNLNSPTIAMVNGQTITAADIEQAAATAIMSDPDPFLRAFYEDREKEIRESRQRAVDARIGSMLIAAEAKKRGLAVDVLVNREVQSRVQPPAEAEIVAVYNSSRDQIGATLEQARPEIINFIKEQRAREFYAAMLTRLKMTNTVVRHADVNTPGLPPGTVLAAVNGVPIRVDAINERMKAYTYKLDVQIYAARKTALDRQINNLLLIAEANKRNIGSEVIIRTEVTDKIKPPTEAEIAKFYEENKANINGDLAATRAGIASFLEEQQQDKLEKDLAERLRGGFKVEVMLSEPDPPVQNIGVGNSPARGDQNAVVTVIEFTDFQCSACGAMYPIIDQVLKPYGNRIRFVVRDFPITQLHPNAYRAALAAGAANAQGKFWEYIDLLFKNQYALEDESLKKYATQVGLDRKRFDAELDSARYASDVGQDKEDGEMYGVESTPTIFINGVKLLLPEYSAEGLRAAIERAFKRAVK